VDGYGNVEVSDPRYERDGIRHVTYKSPALKRRQDMLLVLPEHHEGGLPLVLLLHGAQGSHWAWAYLGGVHETFRDLVAEGALPPMALALPSDGLWGDGSGYLRHGSGDDYERLVVFETPAVASLVDPRIHPGAPLFIAGLSMGGFGALRLGAKYQEHFAGVSAHSAMTELAQLQAYLDEPVSDMRVDADEANVLSWIERSRDRLPPVRFDCGTDDPLIGANRSLHRDLERLGIDHVFQEFPGGHTWSYWGDHIADSLRFFAAKIERR